LSCQYWGVFDSPFVVLVKCFSAGEPFGVDLICPDIDNAQSAEDSFQSQKFFIKYKLKTKNSNLKSAVAKSPKRKKKKEKKGKTPPCSSHSAETPKSNKAGQT